MYRDYKKRTINGTLDYQSKMIDLYMDKAFNKSDVALELPTGSGKTLIGLLIGEYRRRKNKEKVVYLCPNNQLVNQVVEKANLVYGFKVFGFTGAEQIMLNQLYQVIPEQKELQLQIIVVCSILILFLMTQILLSLTMHIVQRIILLIIGV